MAAAKKVVFTNLHKVDLDIAGLKGSVTIPHILSDEDLAIYIEYMNRDEEEEKDDELVMLRQIRVRHESRRHMVKAIDFPGVTLDDFKNSHKTPYPALVFAIASALDPVVKDALNIPNS